MSNRCDPEFAPLLARHFSRHELDLSSSTVFGLWPDGRLAYVNDAWDTFAAENGGQPEIARRWDLGACYFDAIPAPLLPFYRGLLDRAPTPDEQMHPLSHEYECSSAELLRKLNMQVYALAGRAGFVIINSLLVERTHDSIAAPAHSANGAHYMDSAGSIHQCSHCRRVRSASPPPRWDWVPAWVERIPPETSHTVCPICFDYYYPHRSGPPDDTAPLTGAAG